MDRVPVESAILNNAVWCAAVTAAHGIPSRIEQHYWSTAAAVPPYYSNLVTRTREEGAGAQLERIAEIAATPPRPGWGIKDSYARLDEGALARLGLRALFDARWYGRAPGELSPAETGLRFDAVETPAELARWERAWQVSSPAPGRRVFPDALLDDPAIVFLAATRGDELRGGAVANRSDGAVGMSNVFALPGEAAVPLLRDAVRAIARRAPGRPIVGYGRARELAELASLGFRDLGPLRVWESAR